MITESRWHVDIHHGLDIAGRLEDVWAKLTYNVVLFRLWNYHDHV